jgi:hypothetical protein
MKFLNFKYLIFFLWTLPFYVNAESFFLVCDGDLERVFSNGTETKKKSIGIKVSDGELIYDDKIFSFMKYQYEKKDYEIKFSQGFRLGNNTVKDELELYIMGNIDRISGQIEIVHNYYLANEKTTFIGICKTTNKKAF